MSNQMTRNTIIEDLKYVFKILRTIFSDTPQVVKHICEDYEETLSIEVTDRIRDITFSPDGSMLGITSQESSTIYDIETGELLYTVDQTFESGASDWNLSMKFISNDSFVIARYNGDLEYWEIDEVNN